MSEQPDVEIYIKRVALDDLMAWLADTFTIDHENLAGDTRKVTLRFNGKPLTCTIFEKAAKGGYVSVCFEPNHTPWKTDEDCAQAAFDHFALETRCITGGWTTSSADTEGWYRFTADGRSVVNWLT